MSKILIVEGKLNFGDFSYAGKEKMVQWMGNQMAELGHDVTFCTVYDKEKSPKMSDKVRSIPLGMRYYTSFLKRNINLFTLFPFRIIEVLRKNKYDFVVSFGDTSLFILLFLKFLFSYKLIVSERGDPFCNVSILDEWRRGLYKYADKIVFQTKGARVYFKDISKSKTIIIPNPISIPIEEWNYNNLDNRCSIATVGRIDFRQKRQDLLIQSFVRVLNLYPNWVLNIYGSGTDMDKLKKMIEDLQISSNVILHGAVNNVKERLLGNRMFVLSSDFEGIPNALLEAMSIGMPVISTDCTPGGAALLINNNANGMLVPQNNDLALSEAIISMIENPQISIEMGRKARLSMNNYAENKISQMWNSIF